MKKNTKLTNPKHHYQRHRHREMKKVSTWPTTAARGKQTLPEGVGVLESGLSAVSTAPLPESTAASARTTRDRGLRSRLIGLKEEEEEEAKERGKRRRGCDLKLNETTTLEEEEED